MFMRPSGVARAVGMAGFVIVGSLVAVGPAAAASPATLFVSPSGTSGAADTSCSTAAYTKIQDGVTAAAAGDTVIVCPGTYAEMVTVGKSLRLMANGAVTIDATGLDNGIKITASNVVVSWFTVENATGEGILAQQPNPVKGPVIQGMQLYTGAPITHVIIKHNVVKNNDQGGLPANAATTTYAQCKANGEIPGDCGEGIHLWSVAYSQVLLNTVEGNSGGILLTDEFGPTHNNLIQGNVVRNNAYDCGITLPGHNLAFNPTTHVAMPSFGGVYRNVVRYNLIEDNGLLGEGAGVLMAAPAPGTASYDNTIEDNAIFGNDLAGVTMHSHAPGAVITGNRILNNFIGVNNVGGDPLAAGLTVRATTGILAWSAATPFRVTIAGNTIVGDWYGIWLSRNAVAPGAAHSNTFWAVATHVHVM